MSNFDSMSVLKIHENLNSDSSHNIFQGKLITQFLFRAQNPSKKLK